MNETDLPDRRPMPPGLRDKLWAEIEPRLDAPTRSRTLRAPLAVAAAVILLAVGVLAALPLLRGQNVVVAAGPDAAAIRQCLNSSRTSLDAGPWRAGARIDYTPDETFLVIRTNRAAAVCVIENGVGAGLVGGQDWTRYDKLTANRPFAYLTSMNYDKESIHFGITTADVTAISLEGPNNSVSPAAVRDGTFAVRTTIGENSNQPSTNYVHATLADGRVVSGPLRN